jgi:GT2 family glycosyltransferase
MHRYEIMLLTYNRRGIVARCLSSLMPVLRRRNVTWSILDNNSSDGTSQWLLNLKRTIDSPSFKLYLGSDNRGVSGGRDFLLQQADRKADIWMFLDSDVMAVNDDWLDNLTAVLDNDPTVGITGPAGHWITTRRNGEWEWFEPVPDDFRGEIDCVSGYCQMFRSELAQQDGFMDTAFGRYWLEDTNSCLFVRSLGYKVWCSGDIGVRHLYANSVGDDTGAQKMQYLYSKWHGSGLIRAERE